MQTVSDDQNERTLRIKWRDPGDWQDFKVRNVVFEGSWIMFLDAQKQKIRAFPFDLIDEIETNL